MSSARSIAGARQRRAGEAPPVSGRQNSSQQMYQQPQPGQRQQQQGQGQQQQQGQGQQQQQGQGQQQGIRGPSIEQIGQGPGKLSVSDAIGLVTLRLGRLETFMNKIQDDGGLPVSTQDPNVKMVDTSVFKSIVTRLEQLEARKPVATASAPSVPVPVDTNMITNLVNRLISEKYAQTSNQLKNELSEEISSLKELIMKLQSYTMETNQKLVDMVFCHDTNEYVNEYEDQDDEYTNDAVSGFSETSELETKIEPAFNLNLKEMIEQELANEEFNDEVEIVENA